MVNYWSKVGFSQKLVKIWETSIRAQHRSTLTYTTIGLVYDLPQLQPSRNTISSREVILPLKKPATKINMVRLVMEQTDNWYYSEFEAVKLIQRKIGNHSEISMEALQVALPPSRQTSLDLTECVKGF